MSAFRVPFQAADSEFVEKRSRFISHIWPVETEEQAQQCIKDMKAKYYYRKRIRVSPWGLSI